MLLSTMGAPSGYGAPPGPPRRTNPALIVLGVCGGCLLLVVIGGVILGSLVAKSGVGGFIGGAAQIPFTIQSFLKDLKTQNYDHAATLVDPVAKNRLTAAKIHAIEQHIEARLGPIKNFGSRPSGLSNRFIPGPNGQPQGVEYIYEYLVTYQRGQATATFKFLSSGNGPNKDSLNMNLSGKVTDFELKALDSSGAPGAK